MPARTCIYCYFSNGPLDKICNYCGEILPSLNLKKRRNRGSNPRPLHYKCNALPLSYPAVIQSHSIIIKDCFK